MLDNYTKSQIINIFGIFIGITALVITGYGQFKTPQTGMIFFIGILAFVALYFIVSYPVMIMRQRFNQIKENNFLIFKMKKGLNNLNDKINIITDNAKLDARLSFLENQIQKMKNKKGQIDPRGIILIIIILLLVLYLRSKGYF